MNRTPSASAYRRMSFNFGATLLEQMRLLHPGFVEQLREADELSRADNFGHGGAIAQGFNHTILPLNNDADRELQIYWGIEHFKSTFGRDPEGFWLPECAVDRQTLASLDRAGIKFVVLSANSAAGVKGPVEYHKPHRVRGSSVSIFLYDQWLARRLAFDEWLNQMDGAELTRQIDHRLWFHPLTNVAVDGETFGHHKKGGAAALLNYFDKAPAAGQRLTNYGRALEEATGFVEMELNDPSSWSCEHGVGRWSRDCGCDGNNLWREPLREAVDFLAARLDRAYDRTTAGILGDPYGARIKYIHVLLGHRSFEDFLAEQAHRDRVISAEENRRLSQVFDTLAPRQALYTSCAWFFNRMGHETLLVLRAASDAIKRAQGLIETSAASELAEKVRTARRLTLTPAVI